MIRKIKITPVLNGFVCKVGCQTVVFGTVSDLTSNIERYYMNPGAVEKEFIARAVNKMNDGPCVIPRDSYVDDVASVRSETCKSVSEEKNPSPLRETRR